MERLKPQAEQKNVRLETHLAELLPELWLDADRITQVLHNLIGNALRYTSSGGVVSIQAELLAGSAAVQVSVSDSGQGIAPEDLPYVLTASYRADKSRTRSSGGSGLGLAIVKQLVEAHGGSVSAASPIFQAVPPQPGFGTKISFTLPLPKAGRLTIRINAGRPGLPAVGQSNFDSRIKGVFTNGKSRNSTR